MTHRPPASLLVAERDPGEPALAVLLQQARSSMATGPDKGPCVDIEVIRGGAVAQRVKEMLLDGKPANAVVRLVAQAQRSTLAIALWFDCPDWASEEASELVRTALWRALGGFWVFENEIATNELGAMVVAIGGGVPGGFRRAATLRNDEWVEYRFDPTNDLFLNRFREGQLPRGLA